MAKATKTFKIGEYCQGGIITVEIKDRIITVIGKEWDFSKGSSKSSDQSSAKEFIKKSFQADGRSIESDLFMFLTELTTSYYADEVTKWIKSKITLKKNSLYEW